MNPRASIPTTTSTLLGAAATSCLTASANPDDDRINGVMSLNTMPGLGKSGTSAISDEICTPDMRLFLSGASWLALGLRSSGTSLAGPGAGRTCSHRGSSPYRCRFIDILGVVENLVGACWSRAVIRAWLLHLALTSVVH